MFQRVRQRLLHDPVGRHVDPGRELAAVTLDVQVDLEPGIAYLRSEEFEVGEGGLRRERHVLIVGAQDVEQPPHLRERLGARRFDRVEGIVALCAFGAPRAARLEHDHADRVRDDVVQLAGDPRPLLVARAAVAALELEIADTGAGSSNGAGGGHGLVGMRERVAVFGGELARGPRPEGGFTVSARLPL